MQQRIVTVIDGIITVQDETDTYTATVAEFQKEGGSKPPYEHLDYCPDTGSCWINGEAFQPVPNAWGEAMLAKLPDLMAAQSCRHQKITDDRNAADQAAWDQEQAAEEAARQAAMTLAEAKAAKLAEINAACDALLNEAVSSYPDSEVQTFNQQVAEAERYLATTEPEDAPLLSGIAQARNITLIDLVSRVLQKRNTYTRLCGVVIGQRQALEDQLDALTDIDAVRSMPVSITLPA